MIQISPGQVEVSQDIEALAADAGGVAGAHQAEHGLAGGVVAGPLVALEPFGLDRQDRDGLLLGSPFCRRPPGRRR